MWVFFGCSSAGGMRNRFWFYLCVTYLRSLKSWKGAEETLQTLLEGVAKYGSLGPLLICGDLNVKWGEAEDKVDGIPRHKIIDTIKNSQGWWIL